MHAHPHAHSMAAQQRASNRHTHLPTYLSPHQPTYHSPRPPAHPVDLPPSQPPSQPAGTRQHQPRSSASVTVCCRIWCIADSRWGSGALGLLLRGSHPPAPSGADGHIGLCPSDICATTGCGVRCGARVDAAAPLAAAASGRPQAQPTKPRTCPTDMCPWAVCNVSVLFYMRRYSQEPAHSGPHPLETCVPVHQWWHA
jgi:hypothetical protein